MIKKSIVISVSIVGVVLIGLSIWWGGRDRWAVSGLSGDLSDNGSTVTILESQLKAEPESVSIKYNLAYLYYKTNRYEEARDLLKEIIEAGENSSYFSKKVFYNMGNSLFRLAEKEEDLESAIKLLGESLRFYKIVIEIEKQERAYSARDIKTDEDTTINYAIVRKRIKILADKLEQRKKDTERQKSIYNLVKELIVQEEKIQKRLAELQKKQDDKKSVQERNQLLKLRSENRKKLQMIKEQIQEEIGGVKTPVASSRPKIKSI